jgi:hypothetical protein
MLKIFFLLALSLSSAFAQKIELETRLLGPKEVGRLIGPFPKINTADEAQDFKVLMHFQNTRTLADCRAAQRDEALSIEAMFGGEVGILNEEETLRMTAFLLKAYIGAGINVGEFGTEAQSDTIFTQVFGKNGGVKKAIVFFIILIILNLWMAKGH